MQKTQEKQLTASTLFSRSYGPVVIERREIAGSAAQFRTLCSPLFDLSPLLASDDQASRHFSGQLYFLEGVVFCRVVTGGAAIRRTRRHILRSGRLLAFVRLKRGSLIGACDRAPFYALPDQLALHDYSRPFSALLAPSVIEIVYVPKPCLWGQAVSSTALPSFHIIEGDADPFSSICAEIMAKLQFSPDAVTRKDLQLLNLSAQALICDGGGEVSSFRAERVELVREMMVFIEDNLSSHDLSAALLLKAFGVSRATLFRLFEAYGGVRTYMLNRRLFRALLEIAEQPHLRGRIQRALEHWGFSSATHFHRAVKRSFGAAPGALFATGLADPRSPDEQNWMAQLQATMKAS